MTSRVGDQLLLRGVALASLIDAGRSVVVTRHPEAHDALYTVGGATFKAAGFLIKTSTAPKRWQFTFNDTELVALGSPSLDVKPNRRFVALVCKTDGVCCLPLTELTDLLGRLSDGAKSIGVSRPPRSSYHVSGPGRRPLGRAIPASDWPNRILVEETK